MGGAVMGAAVWHKQRDGGAVEEWTLQSLLQVVTPGLLGSSKA